jgi:hypothetical protein
MEGWHQGDAHLLPTIHLQMAAISHKFLSKCRINQIYLSAQAVQKSNLVIRNGASSLLSSKSRQSDLGCRRGCDIIESGVDEVIDLLLEPIDIALRNLWVISLDAVQVLILGRDV